jgi:hypothetical protein
MSTPTPLQQITRLGLILMMGVSMSGCSKTMEWKEEVKLHDGQVIISERHYNLGGYPTIDSRERAALDEIVTFSLPDSNTKIVWKTDYSDAVPEPNGLVLVRFDVVKGTPYIATYMAGCIAYNKWGRPNPPQILFKYEHEQWQRITLAELPDELINAQANVVVGKPAAELLKSFYTVAQVNEQNRYIKTPEYKTILREPLTKERINEMCEVRVLYKGHWILPNDPVARTIIDRRTK